jgi:hypothetical protein
MLSSPVIIGELFFKIKKDGISVKKSYINIREEHGRGKEPMACQWYEGKPV